MAGVDHRCIEHVGDAFQVDQSSAVATDDLGVCLERCIGLLGDTDEGCQRTKRECTSGDVAGAIEHAARDDAPAADGVHRSDTEGGAQRDDGADRGRGVFLDDLGVFARRGGGVQTLSRPFLTADRGNIVPAIDRFLDG